MFDISKFLLPKIERMDIFFRLEIDRCATATLPKLGHFLLEKSGAAAVLPWNSYLAAVSFGFEGGIVPWFYIAHLMIGLAFHQDQS